MSFEVWIAAATLFAGGYWLGYTSTRNLTEAEMIERIVRLRMSRRLRTDEESKLAAEIGAEVDRRTQA